MTTKAPKPARKKPTKKERETIGDLLLFERAKQLLDVIAQQRARQPSPFEPMREPPPDRDELVTLMWDALVIAWRSPDYPALAFAQAVVSTLLARYAITTKDAHEELELRVAESRSPIFLTDLSCGCVYDRAMQELVVLCDAHQELRDEADSTPGEPITSP